MATSRRLRITATTLVLVVAAGTATVTAAVLSGRHHPASAEAGAAPSATAATASGSPAGTIDVSTNDCGSTWAPTTAGPQDITVHNADFHPGEVRVLGVDPQNKGEVFAEVEPFGPSTTVTVHVSLAAGQYALVCYFEDQSPISGPTRTLTGDAPGVRGIVPVPQDQLIRATIRYTAWVRGQLPQLVQQTGALASAIGRGDLGTARSLWLQAHAGYERLGAAYDAFGDLDGTINGLPSGLVRGVHDPGFTGFHRVELGLFGDQPVARSALRQQADALAHAVGDLRTQLAGNQLDPLTFSIRAHEIAENLLRPVLTGHADFGSHSDLATIAAGLEGTREVLDLIRKPLASRYPHVKRLFGQVDQARRQVAALARGPLGHAAIADWPTAQRERVDAVLGDLTERLAPVATLLEPRRVT